MIDVFIGYDDDEKVAFHTLSHSILENSSKPVRITPIKLSLLRDIFSRQKESLQSTQFSFSRFLTPYLSGYNGWSIFIDCDMLFLEDIAKLWELRDDRFAVQVVKHNHIPKEKTKFLNNTQTKYIRKNWSSVMLFNNIKCKALSLDYVNNASGLELHQFKWLKDNQIGEIPLKWNFLVGYNDEIINPSNLHFTNGGPYFEKYKDTNFSKGWRNALKDLLDAKDKSSFIANAIKEIDPS